MFRGPAIELRATQESDLEAVLALERHAENASLVGQWSREEHADTVQRADREHWVIASAESGCPSGYLIAYDLRAFGCGVYVKRVVVAQKSAGLGRLALARYAEHSSRSLEAPYLWLAVYPENLRAQRCYRAAGFVVSSWSLEESRRHNLVAGNSAESRALLMVRSLAG